MKVIDLLNKIANSEEVPKKIKYAGTEYEFSGYDTASKNYKCEYEGGFYSDLFSDIDGACLNDEIEILDEEVKSITKKDLETLGYACGEIKKCIEKGFNKSLNNEPLEDDDKDIPLIPDDELYNLKNNVGLLPGVANEIDFNFKVLKEKINQVVKEFNEYRKENE